MIEFLYQAKASSFGIVVKTTNVEGLRQKLYAARREANDEDLKSLSLVPSPTMEGELWIVKNKEASDG